MMTRFRCAAVVMIFLAVLVDSSSVWALSDPLTVGLAEDHIDITTGFDGAHLTLFGTKRSSRGDVVIIVRGPEKNMVVRKKHRVAGIWMNSEWVSFARIPGFYAYALSEGLLDEVKHERVLKKAVAGVKALELAPKDAGVAEETLKEFRDALVRNKQKEGLFPEGPEKMIMLNDNFFKTRLYIPANVPRGNYTIETLVVEKGRITERALTTLAITQVGLSAEIVKFSKDYGFAYGLMCVAIAAFAGWAVNAVRQKA